MRRELHVRFCEGLGGWFPRATRLCAFDRSEAGAEEARALVGGVLAALDLTYSAAKTRVTHFQDGFVFLGVQFDRHGQRLRVGRHWLPVEVGGPLWHAYRPPGYE